ncbi:MAG: KH domain-containing protein [Microgenomates group bacterium]
MRQLLEFLVKGITGSNDFAIEENQDEDRSDFSIQVDPGIFGMVIGKNGKTIRAIRNLLKVRAILEKRGVNISVVEKE